MSQNTTAMQRGAGGETTGATDMTAQQPKALIPDEKTVMAQAQVYASTWAIVGSRFDAGDGLELAEQEKTILADMVRRLGARITELESQLEAIGAGGVSGPLIGQPQAMPDLSQLTERGAKAWAGVDAQGLLEGFTAADMATAAQQPDSENLRRALKFYGDGEHFIKADDTAWDTVSGEPQNYWCDEAGTATVEDGHIARLALSGHLVRFEDDAAQPAAQLGAYAALPDEVVRLAQVAIRECQYKGNDMPQDWMESAMRACRLIAASHGQAPAGAAHEADSAPAVGYPPLPNLDGSDEQIWEAIFNWKTATPGADEVRKANKVENAIIGTMRACVDADRAARAPADNVQEDAACWHWLAEYLVGTRTDLDDEIVASETVNDLRKLVEAAIKQGASHAR